MSGDQPVTASLSVRDYLSVLRRRRRLLTIFVLAGVLFGVAYGALAPRKWTSTAEVVVRPVNQSLTEASSVAPDKLLTMSTEQQVASSADVALAAGRMLHISGTADELLRHVSVSNPAGTVVLVFDYTASSPHAARAGAQAFARAYLNQRRARYEDQVRHETGLIDKQLAGLDGKAGTSGQRASLTEERSALMTLDTTPGSFNQNATLPIAPSSPNVKLALAIGSFLGLFVGVLAAFARDATDPRLRDATELADRLGRPTLTEIPPLRRAASGGRSGMVLTDAPQSRQAAALRLLRSRLLLAGVGAGRDVVLVTSPRHIGAKSLVAANVAAGLAEAGRSVLLITADGEAPAHQVLFGRGPGLRAAAAGVGTEVRAPQWDGGGTLRVLPAAAGDGPSLYGSGGLARLVASLRSDSGTERRAQRAEIVVVDCPPLLDETDALTVVAQADVVVLVAGPGTMRADLGKADELVAEAGVSVLGGVYDRSGTRGKRRERRAVASVRRDGRGKQPPVAWTPSVAAQPVTGKRVTAPGR